MRIRKTEHRVARIKNTPNGVTPLITDTETLQKQDAPKKINNYELSWAASST